MRLLLRLLGLLRPHAGWVCLGILLSVGTVLANIGLLALSSWFIASMALAGTGGAYFNYTLPAAAVRALALGRTGGRYLERLVNHSTTFRVLSELRVWFYSRVEPLPPSVLASYRSGDLLSRIRADVDTLDDFYVRGVAPLVAGILSSAVAVLYLVRYSVTLAFLDLALLIFAGVVLPAVISALSRRTGKKLVGMASDLRALIVGQAQGMAELVAFGAADALESRIDELGARYATLEKRQNAVLGLSDSLLLLTILMALWSGLFVAVSLFSSPDGTAHRGIDGPSVAMLGVFMLASFEGVMPIPDAARRMGKMLEAARRLFEISGGERAAAPEYDSSRDESETDDSDSEMHLTTQAAEGTAPAVAFRDVTFRYPGVKHPVYSHLYLDFAPRSRVAVVGRTGAGKSSLVNLLMRFYHPDSGRILVGDRDLSAIAPAALPAIFAVAEQRPHFFHSTIRENIALAAPGAAAGEIEAVVSAAQLGDFVAGLPDGIDTVVGETGAALSGGQQRRLSIARALLNPAPVLILDEPTEGLDEPTAAALLKSIFEHASRRTIILITHLSVGLDLVDRIVTIEDLRGERE